MKISLNWLQDFIEFTEKDPQKIAERITVCTAEVEEIIDPGAILNKCCVGKVLSMKKHPNADSLQLCEVQTDDGIKKVVCGGVNLREGMRVAFAHVGATVRWHGTEMMTLERTKIRGEESEGMICGADELDITAHFPESTGKNIVDIGDGDDGVGTSLKEFLQINDVVLDVDNHAITHRADLFSHAGFARECVAIGIAKWKKKPECSAPTFGEEKIPFACKVDTKDKVSKYASCVLKIDDVGETPDWMKQRLEAVGYRSLNLPIDITNYVAAEVGMPLHSFDIDDLDGDVHFRTAKKGEKITTLDDVERELPEGAIVLSDNKGIFDLMGVMGGHRSSTKDTSKNLYVHSAVVDPVAIRNTIIATGHRTDASTVYEKGIPKVSALHGLYRALELFLELVPGATIVSELDEWGEDDKASEISISSDRINAVLGTNLSSKEMTTILSNLEFNVKESKGNLQVIPPLFRLGDITGPHDIVEEVGRIYGYDNIENAMPSASITPPVRDQRMNKVRGSLKDEGYFELLPLSMMGAHTIDKCGFDSSKAAKIDNPIGEELACLAPSTLPALLEHAEREIMNVSDVLQTFFSTHIFEGENDLHNELGLLVTAKKSTDLLHDPFLQLKSHLEHALSKAGYSLSIKKEKSPAPNMHPGRSVSLIVEGKCIGSLFEVHPSICDAFSLPARVAASTINTDALLAIDAQSTIAKPVPQFPAITYDVTMTLDRTKRSEDVLEKIRSSSKLLESVEVVDVYSGKPLQDSEYNLTLRCTYRAADRTLKEEDVKADHEAVCKLTNA